MASQVRRCKRKRNRLLADARLPLQDVNLAGTAFEKAAARAGNTNTIELHASGITIDEKR